MDFTKPQIDCLFENEPNIETIEDALNRIEYTALGYNH